MGEKGRCITGGWRRWLILGGLFMVSFLEVGSIRTLSLFLDDITFQFVTSVTNMNAIYGLISGMSHFLGLITIPFLRYLTIRQLTMFGGVLSSGGLFLASFARSFPQITATLLAYGFGSVCIVLPVHSGPAIYFSDRFEIATGVFISGGSVGVMLMPLLFETLIQEYGWRGGLLLLAGVNAHFILIGSLLIPVKKQPNLSVHAPSNENEVSGRTNNYIALAQRDTKAKTAVNSIALFEKELRETDSCIEEADNKGRTATTNVREDDDEVSKDQQDLDVEVVVGDNSNQGCACNVISSTARLLRERPLMILVCLQVFLLSLSYSTWLLFTIPNAQAKGLAELRASQLSIAGGIANFLGRFSCGFITSRKLARIEVWYMIANFMSATAFFVNYVAESFWFLLILSILYGYTIGFRAPAQFTLMMNAAGKENYNTGLGMLFLCSGVAFPLIGFIAGAIFDATQSYNLAYCVIGTLDVCAALLIIMPVIWRRISQIRST